MSGRLIPEISFRPSVLPVQMLPLPPLLLFIRCCLLKIDDTDWQIVVLGRPVSELTRRIVSPALDGTAFEHHAGVILAGGNQDGGRHTIHVDG